jgi:hypothetical protein
MFANAMMITTSPTDIFLAAGPLRQISPSPLPRDHIRNKSFTVVPVQNMHLFMFNKAGCIHQVFIDGDTAYIV